MKVNQQLLTLFRESSKLQLLVGVAFIVLLPVANAADFGKRIIVTSMAEHDSNPAMVENDKKPVWIFSLIPQVQLDLKDDLNRWYLDAALLVQRHSNQDELVNREDPRVSIGWDRIYESGLFGIKADYQESSARVAELNNTGVFSNKDNNQKNKVLSAKWQHDFAPRWSLLTEGSYTDVSYSATGQLDNYTVGAIKSELGYKNTEKLSTRILLGYVLLSPEQNLGDTRVKRVVLGADYQVNEAFSLSSSAGVHNLSGRQSDTDWEGALKAEYTTEHVSYSAGIARDVTASGVGARKVDTLRLAGKYNLTERDHIGANYSFDQYKKDAETGVNQLNAQTIGMFYERDISERWQARISANHKKLDSNVSNAQGDVIGFTLVYDTLNF